MPRLLRSTCVFLSLALVFAFLHLSPLAAQVSPNPVPSIAEPLVPSAVAPGGAGFTLTLHGTGFLSASTVLWNGHARATTFVSSTQLHASILAGDIAAASTASITVQNPPPGGGLSPVAFLPVRTPAAQVNFSLVPVNNSTTTSPQADQVLTQAIDVNNDGKLDLVWTPNSNNDFGSPAQQVNVQLGNGDGTFQPPISTAAFPGVFVVGYGDFNGDGNLDLLVESGSDSQQVPHVLAIMLGNGDGTFQAPKPIADSATVPGGSGLTSGFVAVADLNGDGKLDVVYAAAAGPLSPAGTGPAPEGVIVLFGNGDGTFTVGGQFATDTYAAQVALADLNGDGKLDLVLAGARPFLGGPGTGSVVETLLGNGDGTFGTELVIPGTQFDTTGSADPANFAVADFNGDGIPDLVYFSPRPALFYPGKGDGTFGTPVPTPASGASAVTPLADFNGDGKLDLWMPQEGVLLLGNGDGTFAIAFDTESLNTPNPVTLRLANVAGDFNGDGKIDAAGLVNGVDANGNGTVTINLLEQNALFPSLTVSPNTLTFATQQVGTESAPQLITVTNSGSAPLDWLGSNIAGNITSFPEQSNNCPLILPPGGSCQFIFTFLPQADGPLSAKFSIFDNFPGSPQVITLSGTGSGMSLMCNTVMTATVNAGQTATYHLELTPTAFHGTASVTCSGAPAASICSVSPASVTLSGNTVVPLVVSVATTANSAALPWLTRFRIEPTRWIPVVTLTMLLIVLVSIRVRVGYRLRPAHVLMGSLLIVCAGCNSGASTRPPQMVGTKAGTYTLIITATSGSVQTTAPLTLTVK